MLRTAVAATLALFVLGAAPARAQDQTTDQAIDQLLGDHAAYRQLFLQLQQAVAAHDAAAVAGLVAYPITVTHGGHALTVRSPAAFVKAYDRIVTPRIAKVIATADYERLFVNDQGIMLGDGEVWLNGVCRDKACAKSDAKVVTIQDGPS